MTSVASVATSFWRGACLRCPRCGEGRMSRGLFDVADACPRCGAAFETGRGEFTGALMFGQGFFMLMALAGWFVLYALLEQPMGLALAWGLAWAVAIPLLVYRNWKGLWVGAMYAFDPALTRRE